MTEWPTFESHTITFKKREDFLSFVELEKSFDIVDIGWSDCVINFEDDEERKKAFELMTGTIYGVSEKDLILGN